MPRLSPTNMHATKISTILVREQGQSLTTRGRLLTGKAGDMLRLSLRRMRPGASTSPSTYMCGTGRMAKSSAATPKSTTGPAKVGVYAGGIEMPFTSTLRIVDPDKLPVGIAVYGVKSRVLNSATAETGEGLARHANLDLDLLAQSNQFSHRSLRSRDTAIENSCCLYLLYRHTMLTRGRCLSSR